VKRLLIGFTIFWGLVATVVVVLLMLQQSAESENPPAAPTGPMTCQGLQRRAEQCADPLADLAAELVEKWARRTGKSGFGASAQGTVARSFVHNAIGEKKVIGYCKPYMDSKESLIVQAKAEMERCYRLAGCAPFVACLRKIGNRLIKEL